MKTYRYLLTLSLVNTVIGTEQLEKMISKANTVDQLNKCRSFLQHYDNCLLNKLVASSPQTNDQIKQLNILLKKTVKVQQDCALLLKQIETKENDINRHSFEHLENTTPHKSSYLSSLFSILWPKKALRTLWDKCVHSRYGQQATKWFTTAAKFTKRQTQKHIRTYRNGPCTII